MYELPELEMARAVLTEKYAGIKIAKVTVNSKVVLGKKSKMIEELMLATIWFVERRAGHLIFHLDSGKRLMILFDQQSTIYAGEIQEPLTDKGDLVLTFVNRYVVFYGLAEHSVQLLTVREVDQQLNIYAPDPLDKRFTIHYWKGTIAKKRCSLKSLLLDTKVVSGLGPMYSDEILFEAKMHPARKVYTLSEEEQEKLYQAMISVLKNAISDGGSMKKPLFSNDILTGSYKDKLNVFEREGDNCNSCGHTITQIAVAKQKCYICDSCQS